MRGARAGVTKSQSHGVTRGGGDVIDVTKCDKEFKGIKEIKEVKDGPP